jgi:hypothetical protein
MNCIDTVVGVPNRPIHEQPQQSMGGSIVFVGAVRNWKTGCDRDEQAEAEWRRALPVQQPDIVIPASLYNLGAEVQIGVALVFDVIVAD